MMAVPGFSPGIKGGKDEPLRRMDEEISSAAKAREAQGLEPTEREQYEADGANYRIAQSKKGGKGKKEDGEEKPTLSGLLSKGLSDSGKEMSAGASKIDTAYHGPSGGYAAPNLIPIPSLARALGGPISAGGGPAATSFDKLNDDGSMDVLGSLKAHSDFATQFQRNPGAGMSYEPREVGGPVEGSEEDRQGEGSEEDRQGLPEKKKADKKDGHQSPVHWTEGARSVDPVEAYYRAQRDQAAQAPPPNPAYTVPKVPDPSDPASFAPEGWSRDPYAPAATTRDPVHFSRTDPAIEHNEQAAVGAQPELIKEAARYALLPAGGVGIGGTGLAAAVNAVDGIRSHRNKEISSWGKPPESDDKVGMFLARLFSKGGK
jgi:hypothetical protein